MLASIVRPDGARLSYAYSPRAGARPVVLVHGWMASSAVWDGLLAALPDIPALTVDLRGAGASSAGTAGISLETFAEDVLAIADHAGLSAFHLVGHSMGAQVAQLVAAAHPARLESLALLSPVPLGGLPLPDEVAASFRASGGVRAAFDGILTAACRELSSNDRGALLDAAMRIAPEVIAAGFDAWTRGAKDARPEAIACRTLVLATSDPFLPVPLLASAVAARIPGAVLREMPGPGHYPQVERPAETAAALRDLWSGA